MNINRVTPYSYGIFVYTSRGSRQIIHHDVTYEVLSAEYSVLHPCIYNSDLCILSLFHVRIKPFHTGQQRTRVQASVLGLANDEQICLMTLPLCWITCRTSMYGVEVDVILRIRVRVIYEYN